MNMSDSIRWGLVVAGVIILGGDIYGDIHFFSLPNTRTAALMGSAIVRNLLLVVALVGLTIRADWARYAVLLTLLFGVVRRGMFFVGLGALSPEMIALAHAGADILFRLLLVFGLVALFGQAAAGDDE